MVNEIRRNRLLAFDDWLSAELPSVHGAVHASADALRRADAAGAPYAQVLNRHLYRIANGELLHDMVSGMFRMGAEAKRAADCYLFEDHYSYPDTSFAGCFPETAQTIDEPARLYRNSYLDPGLWREQPVAAFDNIVQSTINAGVVLLFMRATPVRAPSRPTVPRGLRRPRLRPKAEPAPPPIAPDAMRLSLGPESTVAIEPRVATILHRGERFAVERPVWDELVRTKNCNATAFDAMALERRLQRKRNYTFDRSVGQSLSAISKSSFGSVRSNIARAIERRGGRATVTITGDGAGHMGAWIKGHFGNRVSVRNISLWPAEAANAAAYDIQMIADLRALPSMPWASDVILDIYGPAFHLPRGTSEMILRGLRPEGRAFFISRSTYLVRRLQEQSPYTHVCGSANMALGSAFDLPMRAAQTTFAGTQLEMVMPQGSVELFIAATRPVEAAMKKTAARTIAPSAR